MDADSPHLPTESSLLLESFGADRGGRMRAMLLHLLLLAVFGVFLPWQKGLDFLDPVITCAYVCLGVVFAGPAAAVTFARNPPQTFAAAIKRVLLCVLYGECVAWAMLIAGLISISASHHFRFLSPELDTLATAGALGLAASFAFALAAAWIALRFSVKAARSTMRILLLALLGAFYFYSRWLPDVAGRGALAALVLAGGMLAILNRAYANE